MPNGLLEYKHRYELGGWAAALIYVTYQVIIKKGEYSGALHYAVEMQINRYCKFWQSS